MLCTNLLHALHRLLVFGTIFFCFRKILVISLSHTTNMTTLWWIVFVLSLFELFTFIWDTLYDFVTSTGLTNCFIGNLETTACNKLLLQHAKALAMWNFNISWYSHCYPISPSNIDKLLLIWSYFYIYSMVVFLFSCFQCM